MPPVPTEEFFVVLIFMPALQRDYTYQLWAYYMQVLLDWRSTWLNLLYRVEARIRGYHVHKYIWTTIVVKNLKFAPSKHFLLYDIHYNMDNIQQPLEHTCFYQEILSWHIAACLRKGRPFFPLAFSCRSLRETILWIEMFQLWHECGFKPSSVFLLE